MPETTEVCHIRGHLVDIDTLEGTRKINSNPQYALKRFQLKQ